MAMSFPMGSLHAVRVTDTLDALQRLAAWHRATNTTGRGITGSNGKTIVKEWLFQCLRGTTHLVRSPGSWNSQVGVPLSVWGWGPNTSWASSRRASAVPARWSACGP